jgi:hypothetical protein
MNIQQKSDVAAQQLKMQRWETVAVSLNNCWMIYVISHQVEY